MKEIGNNLAQLLFIIMVMITLAVSTAALSQWANSGDAAAANNGSSGNVERVETPAPEFRAQSVR